MINSSEEDVVSRVKEITGAATPWAHLANIHASPQQQAASLPAQARHACQGVCVHEAACDVTTVIRWGGCLGRAQSHRRPSFARLPVVRARRRHCLHLQHVWRRCEGSPPPVDALRIGGLCVGDALSGALHACWMRRGNACTTGWHLACLAWLIPRRMCCCSGARADV